MVLILIRFEWHILRNNTLHLRLHLTLISSMLDITRQTKHRTQSNHGVDHIHSRDRFLYLLRATESVGDAFLYIVTGSTGRTDGGGGTRGIARADCLEDRGKFE